MHACICHSGVVSQTLSSIVHAQGASHQFTSNKEKTNNWAFLLTFIWQFWSAEDVCTVCTLDNGEKQLVSCDMSV